ncbi:MAG: IS256 family transposase [Sporolactobacillus sp.]
MNQFTTKIMSALAQQQDLDEIFRQHLEEAVNELLKLELSSFLGYEPYDREGFHTGNSRNGQYFRKFKTRYGELTLQMPRDRNGDFHQHTVPAYRRNSDALETTVIQLYRKGITTSEIANLMEEMYGHFYTPQTISNMTQAVSEQVTQFKTRPLSAQYVCVYLDATYLPLRRDTVEKEAIHIAIGVKPDGTKEVLAYTVAPTESTGVWSELLTDIRERGVQDVLLFIADGLVGLQSALEKSFPKAKLQRCLIHVSRTLCNHVRVNDRKPMMDEFKALHQAADRKEAQELLKQFLTHWQGRYARLMDRLKKTENLLTFLEFPTSIRASIYSTNMIESFNKKLKRYSKRKEQFPNEDSLDRFLVTQMIAYNTKFSVHCHRGFNQCRDTLESIFH